MATCEKKRVSPSGKIGIGNCAAVLFAQVPKKCTDPDLNLHYILLLGRFAFPPHFFLELGVCFPQTCSSAVRMFAASTSRLHYYRRIVSFPQQQIRWMPCKLDSTKNPRSFEKYPTLPPKKQSRTLPWYTHYQFSMKTLLSKKLQLQRKMSIKSTRKKISFVENWRHAHMFSFFPFLGCKTQLDHCTKISGWWTPN